MAARVFLLGGTSYTGKSTTARALADRLGWDCVSTDRLGRHPGRPWADDGPVPDHVLRHYRTLPVDELTAGQLRHYERLWPAVADLVTARIHAASRYAEAGDDQRAVVDSFVGRTLGYQRAVVAAVRRHHLPTVEVDETTSTDALVARCLRLAASH